MSRKGNGGAMIISTEAPSSFEPATNASISAMASIRSLCIFQLPARMVRMIDRSGGKPTKMSQGLPIRSGGPSHHQHEIVIFLETKGKTQVRDDRRELVLQLRIVHD